MRTLTTYLMFAVSGCSITSMARAQDADTWFSAWHTHTRTTETEAEEAPRRYLFRHWDSVHIDQDLFAGPFNEDRSYTMGISLAWRGDKARSHYLNAASLLARMDRLTKITHADDATETLKLGIGVFTPDRIEETDPIRTDRPYSSILAVTTTRTSHDSASRTTWASELTLGALGLPLAKWGQTAFHWGWREAFHVETPYTPLGWHNQISDGGEPTAMYAVRWSKIPIQFPGFDLTFGGDASLGYYTMASTSAAIRFGYINIGRTSTESDPTSAFAYNNDINRIWGGIRRPDLWQGEFYLQVGARTTAVGYNALLQGQLRKNEFDLNPGQIENKVLETSFGGVFRSANGWHTAFVCTRRSPEHKLLERRWHVWCGLSMNNPF